MDSRRVLPGGTVLNPMTDLAASSARDEASASRAPAPLRPVRAAVAGLDRLGVAHVSVLSAVPDCELVGFCDPRRAARTSLRGIGHLAPGFADLPKLLARTHPDVVIVSSAEAARGPMARLALEAGASVLAERPMARTAEEAAGLADLAAERGLKLAGAHALAFEPVFVRAHAAIAAGAVGAPRHVRSSMFASRVFSAQQSARFDPALVSGGVVSQMASDLLFLLLWSFGQPLQVRATWNRIYGGVEDELHGMMTLASGLEVGFDSSWSVPGYPQPATVVELEGDNGKLLVSNDALELDLVGPRGGWPAGHTRVRDAELPQLARFDLDGESPYLMDAAFLEWATGGSEPPNTGAAALRVQRTVEALYASARQGGATVPVGA